MYSDRAFLRVDTSDFDLHTFALFFCWDSEGRYIAPGEELCFVCLRSFFAGYFQGNKVHVTLLIQYTSTSSKDREHNL